MQPAHWAWQEKAFTERGHLWLQSVMRPVGRSKSGDEQKILFDDLEYDFMSQRLSFATFLPLREFMFYSVGAGMILWRPALQILRFSLQNG
jgi:hypothetical protein